MMRTTGGSPVSNDHRTVDLFHDGHVNTAFAAGRAAVGELVTAAEAAGLSGLTFADVVDPEVAWLRAYVETIRRARRRTALDLRAAVMVEVVRADGWVALPPDLSGLDAVTIALTGVPTRSGIVTPTRAREMLRWGALAAADVVELTVDATVRALERAGRYAPTQLARPLGVLTDVGLDESDVDDAAIAALAAGCRATRTVVEVSEAWRSPSRRVAAALAAAGVGLVAASEATEADQVGRFSYVRSLAAELIEG
jgi:putative hydrolase